MKKLIYVLVAIVLAAIVYFVMTKPAVAPTDTNLQAGQETSQAGAPLSMGNNAFTQALAAGGDFECDISFVQASVQSKSVVRVSGTQLRADFESDTVAGTMKGSMIQTGGFVYTWSDAMPQGFKAPATTEKPGDPMALLLQGQNPPEGVVYDCRPWTADPSVFAVPKDISFGEAPALPPR